MKIYQLTRAQIKEIAINSLVYGYGEGVKNTPFQDVYNEECKAFDCMFDNSDNQRQG